MQAHKVARSTRGGGGLLLSERGLQVAQHTDLAEQDRSGVVAVERAHLPVLKTEDIAGRGVELKPLGFLLCDLRTDCG